MACAPAAATKEATSASASAAAAAVVAATSGGGGTGGVSGASGAAVTVAAAAGSPSGAGGTNRQIRGAMEGVGSRVIRGPDWKWGKQQLKMDNDNSSKCVEKSYYKKSQLEQILLRPETYIGTVERTKKLMWVYNKEEKKMVQKELCFVPGLYKIFDEILVNAVDNKQRDKSMSFIKIDIDPEKNVISIWNDGKGIPVVMHKEEKMYVPTMVFGHLLTSSNYNDEEEQLTGGRYGFGAKLCNIFSTLFTVETGSSENSKCFQQTWSSNMKEASAPKIDDFHKKDYTKVVFSPDLSIFKMEKLDEDIVALMSRRAYDVASTTKNIEIHLNGEKLAINNFKDYIDLYLKGSQHGAVYKKINKNWEVAVAPSVNGFQQISFVNSIATTDGGCHVDHVVKGIVKQIFEVLKKKNKDGLVIEPFHVQNHLWVFINCLIVNPKFDSQTKENMAAPTNEFYNFDSECTLPHKFFNRTTNSRIVELVHSSAKLKALNIVAEIHGNNNKNPERIPNLKDAYKAGTDDSFSCSLILTDGYSAKSFALSVLGIVGQDRYGVYHGKLSNLANTEISNLINILGLQYKKKYLNVDDLKSLRYGKVIIITNQCQDGTYFKGLLINFFHTNWPELLRLPFLEQFITPIIKATKENEELSFYSLPEFEEWKSSTLNHSKYNIKYYNGLFTSSFEEIIRYLKNMRQHCILFKYTGIQDDNNIKMLFSRKSADQRKQWLTEHMKKLKQRKLDGLPERYLYTKNTKNVIYSEFINLELVHVFNSDNVRSIPSIVDGLKPGQRKVIFTSLKQNDKEEEEEEVHVDQLAASISKMAAYHHGETSLCTIIVNLAQNFVGSNNINLLEPIGHFGTRLTGGKDPDSSHCMSIKMSPLTRLIYHPADDPLLNYQRAGNLKIEPEWYIPIIPMILVNGAEGIGTGWVTKIPNHNPRDIIKNLRRMIENEKPQPMQPWYKNFKGTINHESYQHFLSVGTFTIIGDNKIEITELPIGTWTEMYRENVLEPLRHGSEKIKSIISDYKEYQTYKSETVNFVIELKPGEFKRLKEEEGGFHNTFKLSSRIVTSQLNAFDPDGCLKEYNSAIDILNEFFPLRLQYYRKRKQYMEGQLQAQADLLAEQVRFILEKYLKQMLVDNEKENVIIDEFIKRGYRSDPVKEWEKKNSMGEDSPESEDVTNFDYLLNMPMRMLTEEKKKELIEQRDNKLLELNALKVKTPEDLWRNDLNNLENKLDEVEHKEGLVQSRISDIFGKCAKKRSENNKDSDSESDIELSTFPRCIPQKESESKKTNYEADGTNELAQDIRKRLRKRR